VIRQPCRAGARDRWHLSRIDARGGNLGQVLQPTAAMIVFGGTLGAVLIQYPMAVALVRSAGWRRYSSSHGECAIDGPILVKYGEPGATRGHHLT